MRSLAIAIVLGAASAPAADAVAATRESTTTPFPGIVHEVWSEPAIPARIHVVQVDLTSAEITVHATREEHRGRTTGAFATTIGAQVAINGDYFAPAGYVPDGLAMGDSAPWASTSDDNLAAVFRFGKVASRTDGLIIVPESVVAFGDLPSFTTGAIGGHPMLVRAGQVASSFDCADGGAIPCLRAPRTAIGLSEDNRTLWLVTVDGWQAGSLGMTAAELAGFLRDRGVRDAIALDGGGASTMYLAGAVVNQPSDGVQRPVANHLGIVFGAQPPGTLLGEIRDGSLSGPDILGAVATLDDGRPPVTSSAANPGYDFSNVAPRYACVTVEKTGYNTVTQCRQVEPGILNFNSIVMFPVGTGPDAGVPDAATAIDAPDVTGDGGNGGGDGGNAGADGGDGGGGGEGGCCAAGDRDGAGAAGVAWLALAVVFGLSGNRSRRPRRRS